MVDCVVEMRELMSKAAVYDTPTVHQLLVEIERLRHMAESAKEVTRLRRERDALVAFTQGKVTTIYCAEPEGGGLDWRFVCDDERNRGNWSEEAYPIKLATILAAREAIPPLAPEFDY